MKRGVIYILRLYQRSISPDQGILRVVLGGRRMCTMYPSCSEYTICAVEKFGVSHGLFKGFFRILRCHPFQKKLIDVP